MAIIAPLLNLTKISGRFSSIFSSLKTTEKTTVDMKKILFRKTKVKKEAIQGDKKFAAKKKESIERKRREDALEAREIITKPISAITRSAKGFLERILDFIGSLLLGWLAYNLPTIITMATELIARIQRLVSIFKSFLGNILDTFTGFGKLLGAVFQNVISFDFFDTSNRVKNSLSDLSDNFNEMGSQFDEGMKLVTTSLGQGLVTGEDAAPTGTDYTYEGSGGTTVSGGNSDFWTLVAVAAREDGDPQGRVDVAQSIYNRLASGAYSGKTISELILARTQYQPTWDYPRKGKYGVPNPEWYNITDAESAAKATGMDVSAIKNVASSLTNPTLQKNAAEFVQGRTDFTNYTKKNRKGQTQRKSGDNYFGWDWNYGGNVVASVPKFGTTVSQSAQPQISSAVSTSVVDQFKGKPGGAAGIITSERGWRDGRMHHGIDIAPAGRGYYVALKLSGKVNLVAFDSRGYGHYVDIKSGNIIYRFAHLAKVYVKQGQTYTGQTIGEIGSTGRSTGPHLHFEVRPGGGNSINPRPYLGLLSIGKQLTGVSGKPINAPAQVAPAPPPAPSLAQISSPPQANSAQQIQQESKAGQQVVVVDDRKPPQMIPVGGGGGGQPQVIVVGHTLNSFIKNKLLLDLVYT